MEFRFSDLICGRSISASFRNVLLLAVAVLLLVTPPVHAALITADQVALTAIAAHWPVLQSGDGAWSSSEALLACDQPWRGVVCGTTTGVDQRVLELNLQGQQLAYGIAPAIFDLDALSVLNLSNNTLNGTLPSIWASLANLSSLDLSSNFFSGPLPDELGDLSGSRMQKLRLDANSFSGLIPSALQSLTALTHLNVSATSLSGYLLDWIGVYSQLRSLSAAFTKLYPTTWIPLPPAPKVVYAISPGIANCTHLNLLDLRSTNVGYPMPGELGSLTELETLALQGSINFPNVTHLVSLRHLDFSFDIPRALPSNMGDMQGLEYLHIGGMMTGQTLPISLGSLAALREINLEYTAFNMAFPNFFASLSNLVTIRLRGAGFTGMLPLGSWPLAEVIDVSDNKFAQLPTTLSTTPTALVSLMMDENSFTGPFPSWLGDLNSLKIFTIQDNQFTSLPASIGNLASNLEILVLSANPLGDLPIEMAELTNLRAIALAGINFASAPFNATHYHSHIFDIVVSMRSLETLVIVGTHITGTIPETISQLSSLHTLHLSDNQLTGPIPDSILDLPNIEQLYLHENQLNGTIPAWLGSKTTLRGLGLSSNAFEGAIPPELAQLKVRSLCLAHNKLSGTIPYELGEAPYIIALDLSDNELTGGIPTSFNVSAPSHYFSGLDLSANRLTFCPSEIQEFPFYLHVSGICNLADQKEPWTRPYDCGCLLDAFDNCRVDYPLEQCVPCIGNPPSQDPNWECQHGQYVLIGNKPSLTNTTLTIGPSPVVIPGNLTTSPITFEGIEGSLKVLGCASITNITLVLTLADIEKLLKLSDAEKSKVLVQSGCTIGEVPVSLINPENSCARAYAFTSGSSGSLIAAFNVDKSRCAKSRWWIILVAVIATLLVLTVAAALVWYFVRQHKADLAHTRVTSRSTAAH
jgi:Leucine-rich repeat (LRR) protein